MIYRKNKNGKVEKIDPRKLAERDRRGGDGALWWNAKWAVTVR